MCNFHAHVSSSTIHVICRSIKHVHVPCCAALPHDHELPPQLSRKFREQTHINPSQYQASQHSHMRERALFKAVYEFAETLSSYLLPLLFQGHLERVQARGNLGACQLVATDVLVLGLLHHCLKQTECQTFYSYSKIRHKTYTPYHHIRHTTWPHPDGELSGWSRTWLASTLIL